MEPKTNTPFSLELLEEKLAQKSEAKKNLPHQEKMERKAGGQGKKFSHIDFDGRVLGFLTPLGPSQVKSKYGIVWRFRCKCGNEVDKIANQVFHQLMPSCGCYRRPRTDYVATMKHGLSGHYIYNQWCSIIARCTNPKNPRWESYGGRGILISPEWRNDPQKFADYMGPRPSINHTIDRIDNNKGYEPGNLRWADRKTQQRNRRNNVIIEYNGLKMCAADWSDKLGLGQNCLMTRLRRGWPLEKALSPNGHFRVGRKPHPAP